LRDTALADRAAVLFDRRREGDPDKIDRLKLAEPFESLTAGEFYTASADLDEAVRAQPGQRTIEVRNAEAEGVAHDFLGKRQIETRLRCPACHRQSRIYFEQQMRESFEGCTPPGADDVLGARNRLMNC
jgi:hypothetical protein